MLAFTVKEDSSEASLNSKVCGHFSFYVLPSRSVLSGDELTTKWAILPKQKASDGVECLTGTWQTGNQRGK